MQPRNVLWVLRHYNESDEGCPAGVSAACGPALRAGFVRYMLSAGRGGFGLSGNECLRPALYVMVYSHEEQTDEQQQGARASPLLFC